MRLSRDKLIVLGIAALYEAAERATAEPMRPGFALRAVRQAGHLGRIDRRQSLRGQDGTGGADRRWPGALPSIQAFLFLIDQAARAGPLD